MRDFSIKKVLLDNEFIGFDKNFSVQDFLSKTPWGESFLSSYKIEGRTASQIIESGCYLYNLNQRILLVALQREQSVLSMRNSPEQRVIDRILGFGCFEDGKDLVKFYGFDNQIANACRRYKEFYNEFYDKYFKDNFLNFVVKNFSYINKEFLNEIIFRYTEFNILSLPVNMNKNNPEPQVVSPENGATWSLYRYNPQISGAKLTYNLYKQLFGLKEDESV